MTHNLAIAATILRWNGDTEHWIKYHQAIGFDRLYIFCDDPSTLPTIAKPGVVTIACDQSWWRTHSAHPLFHDLNPDHRIGTLSWMKPQYVMLRQILNAESAMAFATKDRVAWLLHLDGDELFYSTKASPVEHFRNLDRIGISQARYLNLEAVVQSEVQRDLFVETTLFKKNRVTLSMGQRSWLETQLSGRPWFLSYSNGKSGVKVAPLAHPTGVHGFSQDSFVGSCTVASPAILHFPYSTYLRFREKHESFGTFETNTFFGERWHPPALMVAAQECLSHGDEAFRRLYHEWILMDSSEANQFLRAGVLAEIFSVSEVLRGNARGDAVVSCASAVDRRRGI
jgi:hypothetical protein